MVEQPRRKKYKEAFKQSASDCHLYDQRNLKALDKKGKTFQYNCTRLLGLHM